MKVVDGRQFALELETLIASLQSLDALDPAWPEIGRLVESANEIVQTKSKQRLEWEKATNVVKHLSGFYSAFADDLAFHELEWPEEWATAGAVHVPSPQDADQVVRLLDSLSNLFQDHRALREQQASASSGKELREIRSRLVATESALDSTYQDLLTLLGTARVVLAEAERAPEVEAQLESEPAVEAEPALEAGAIEEEPHPEAEPAPDGVSRAQPETAPTVETELELGAHPVSEAEPQAEPGAGLMPEANARVLPEPKPVSEPETEPTLETGPVPEAETRPALELKPAPEAEPQAALEVQPAPEPQPQTAAAPAPVEQEATPSQQAEERPAPEAISPDDPRPWLWERLVAGDLATAYWLAHGDTDVPAWLLKACLLARYVRVSGDEPSNALSGILYDHADPVAEAESCGLSRQQALLLTALAAVGPALKAQEPGAVGWLQAVAPLAKSAPFLQPILDFVTYGIALGPETVAAGRSEEERRAELLRLQRSAEEWLTQQRSARLGYAPASDALNELAGERHPLGRAVAAVARGDRNADSLGRHVLDEYLDSDESMRNLVNATARARRGPSAPRIVGKFLETMLGRLSEIREILSAWSRLVREPRSAEPGWRETRIAAFREAFRSAWSACGSAPPASLLADPRTAALAKLVWAEVGALADGLILPTASSVTAQDEAATWIKAMRRPLLVLVPAPVTLQGGAPEQLSPDQVRTLVLALRSGRTLRDALRLQVEARDFLAARLLLEEEELAADAEIRSEVERAQEEARALLRERVDALRNDLEVNTALHVVTDSERSDFEGRLLSLEALAEEDQRYGQLFAECEQIEHELDHLRQVRVNSLRERVPDLDEQIAQAEGQTKDAAQRYRDEAVAALERGDLALADEYLSLVERTIQYGYEAEADIHLQVLDPDRFERFRASMESLTRLLEEDDKSKRRRVRDLVAAAKGIPNVLDQNNVPGARKVEIAAALDGFHLFKTRSSRLERNHIKAVEDIVTYLGFQRPSAVTRPQAKDKYWHYEVRTTDAGASPLPHFGSERNGLYDLLVVWERPNAERLGQIVQETHTATRCPIILFLGRLTFKQREEWGAYCKKHELTVLLVDEGLLYWLAGVRENRLRAAVAYSLPWGYANPYKPVAEGLVAPEMFVGRKSVIRELADLKGSVIIYGGRQLGKSAILRAIERDYHDPSRKWFVFYNDIRNLGSVQDVGEIWRQLRDWAVSQKLVDPKVLDRPDNLTNELVRYFEKNPEAQVRVLLDEADAFLAADAKRNFAELQRLKRLMGLTDRRFKVVLSGLHSVQRYCTMPNHPFAHLNPVGIGPLDPADARSLIVEPMQMLGFVFTEETEQAIYRIFAITNYQPALIQHICRELVRNRQSFRPPYRLTVKMVEDLARQPSVRQFISERFRWTVGLDPRYEALVYSMILEQSGDRDGFRRQFSAREALELARSWWPKGFDRMMPDEAASLLRELVGLGVLVRLESGSFRLRNANVVRMLGSQSEIWERMQQLAETEPQQEFDPRKVRMKLPGDRRAWSPFTLEQEADLAKSHAAVHLVFCSTAQGRGRLLEALQHLVCGSGNAETEGAVLTPPPECLSINNLRAFLDKSLTRGQSGRYILYLTATHLLNCSEPPHETLRQIATLLQRRRSRHRLLQCVVSFDATETARWYLELGPGEEERVGANITVCYPWPREMIRHSLNLYGMIDNESVVDEVLDATGGWPVLVEAMMERLPAGGLENVDPRSACRELRAGLLQGGVLAERFLADVGLREVPLGEAICRMVVELEPSDLGEITADLVSGARSQEELTRQALALQQLGILRRDREHVVCDPIVRVALGL